MDIDKITNAIETDAAMELPGLRESLAEMQVGRAKGGTMDGFRRMLWVGRQHSADHIPVSALQLWAGLEPVPTKLEAPTRSYNQPE